MSRRNFLLSSGLLVFWSAIPIHVKAVGEKARNLFVKPKKILPLKMKVNGQNYDLNLDTRTTKKLNQKIIKQWQNSLQEKKIIANGTMN